MQHILAINSSVAGEGSASRLLVEETVDRLQAASVSATVNWRDLGADPVPHLTTATLAGVRGEPATVAELASRALSDALIAELRAADTIVMGVPMYNFSVPTGLRAWFDHVLRAGETFRYSSAGPEGLLGGKRVIVIEARGGYYSEGPAQAFDFRSRTCGTCSRSWASRTLNSSASRRWDSGPRRRRRRSPTHARGSRTSWDRGWSAPPDTRLAAGRWN